MSLSDRLRAARDAAAATPLPPDRPDSVLIVSDRDPHGRTVTREPIPHFHHTPSGVVLTFTRREDEPDAALPAWRRRDLTKDLTGEVRS